MTSLAESLAASLSRRADTMAEIRTNDPHQITGGAAFVAFGMGILTAGLTIANANPQVRGVTSAGAVMATGITVAAQSGFNQHISDLREASIAIETIADFYSDDPETTFEDKEEAIGLLSVITGLREARNIERDIARDEKDVECFPAATPILLADNTTTPIADIRVGDRVLAYDRFGRLEPHRVTRLYRNVTTAWLVLSFTAADGERSELTVTPGHRFLNEFGRFEQIGHIAARDGRIIDAEGRMLAFTAQPFPGRVELLSRRSGGQRRSLRRRRAEGLFSKRHWPLRGTLALDSGFISPSAATPRKAAV